MRGGGEHILFLLPSSVSRSNSLDAATSACGVPNQRFKLTEPAVDDFAARQYAENDMISRYVRATNYMGLASRRRSLTAVR